MRIDCPHCSAVYDLPPEKVPPGRAVRCVRCTQLWTPVPLAAARVVELRMAVPPAGDAVGGVGGPAAKEAPSSALARMKLPGAWLLTVLVLVVLGWAAVSRRAEIMQAWPPSERAYIALGLAPRS